MPDSEYQVEEIWSPLENALPNTLVHIALQSLATRAVLPSAPLHLIYAGCVIPDFPWIVQRMAKTLVPALGPYDLRLYSVNQASFAGSLILCAAMSAILVRPFQAFAILALGSAMHLLLDPLEVKWANGVSWLVPFDWKLTQFNFFWPEHALSYALTLIGLGFFIWHLRNASREQLAFSRQLKAWIAALGLLALYFVLPILGIPAASQADNHYVATLRSDDRTGKYVEFDRAHFVSNESVARIQPFNGEWLDVIGIENGAAPLVSVRGRFLDPKTVLVTDYHFHHGFLRDISSYGGLALVAGIWVFLGVRACMRSPAPSGAVPESVPEAK